MGLVYLIQPVPQCWYKIGHTTKHDTLTCLQKMYPAQSRIICVVGLVPNPLEVERALVQAFHQHFKPMICGAGGYFEGDVDDMRDVFNKVLSVKFSKNAKSCRGFGHEDVAFLNGIKLDELTVNDLLDLVFFNKDHERNQNVRKLDKKNGIVEFRVNEYWNPESIDTALPKIIRRMRQILPKFNITESKYLKDLLYYKSVRGPLTENQIKQNMSFSRLWFVNL